MSKSFPQNFPRPLSFLVYSSPFLYRNAFFLLLLPPLDIKPDQTSPFSPRCHWPNQNRFSQSGRAIILISNAPIKRSSFPLARSHFSFAEGPFLLNLEPHMCERRRRYNIYAETPVEAGPQNRKCVQVSSKCTVRKNRRRRRGENTMKL